MQIRFCALSILLISVFERFFDQLKMWGTAVFLRIFVNGWVPANDQWNDYFLRTKLFKGSTSKERKSAMAEAEDFVEKSD